MAPFPDTITDVFFLDYTTGRKQHTLQVRHLSGNLPAAQAWVLEFLSAVELALCSTWAVIGGRARAAGSNITLPVSLAGGLATFSGGDDDPLPEVAEPREFRWVGRGLTSGRRVSLSLYGLQYNTPNNYRYLQADAPPGLAATFAALIDGSVDGVFATIAGDAPRWNPYVNVQNNSYWETEARG